MSDRLVTVVVINYNYARFLSAAIDSALRQSHPSTEVVVVDDGSTDDSARIIDGYGKRVMAVFKENGGQASAFTAGFEASRGEVVLFLDADDVLLEGAAETSALLLGDGVSKVHWRMREIDAEGRPTGALYPRYELSEGYLRDRSIAQGPLHDSCAPTSGNAWARSFLSMAMPVLECGDKHGADAYLLSLAPIYGSIVTAPRPLSCYRVHGGNFSEGPLTERVERWASRFDQQAGALSRHLAAQGVQPDLASWKVRNQKYRWIKGLFTLPGRLAQIIPIGERLALIDDKFSSAQVLKEWTLDFYQYRGGRYFGPPEESSEIVHWLQEMAGGGTKYLLIMQPSHWWLDYYEGFAGYLRRNAQCMARGEDFLVFRLLANARGYGEESSAKAEVVDAV